MRRIGVLFAVLGLAACTATATSPQAGTAPGRKFVVFFQPWSAGLDAPALQTIAAAAAAAAKDPAAPVTVTGYADPTGSVQANIFLTETRGQEVVDQLVADGVKATRIHRLAAGEVSYQLTSQESRRAVIAIGGS